MDYGSIVPSGLGVAEQVLESRCRGGIGMLVHQRRGGSCRVRNSPQATDMNPLRFLSVVLALCVLAIALSFAHMSVAADDETDLSTEIESDLNRRITYDVSVVFDEARYADQLERWRSEGHQEVRGVELVASGREALTSAEGQFEVRESFEGQEDVLLWTSSDGWAEWEFVIPQDGLYSLGLQFFPLEGKSTIGRPIERGFMIDGGYPFNEARRLVLYRQFRDIEYEDIGESRFYNMGDERRPGQEEIKEWQSVHFEDSYAADPDPMLVYLSKGNHTVRLIGGSEPVAISKVYVKSREDVRTYSDVKATCSSIPIYVGEDIEFEAEITSAKALPSLRREPSFDPEVQPFDPDVRLLNTFGGWNWRWGRQWAEWAFEVPEDGLYKIGIYCMQNTGTQLPSYRMIEIDGRVPFEELKRYRFDYSRKWVLNVLSDPDDNPYLFHLTKGTHTIRLTPVMGPLGPTLRAINDVILDMSDLYRKIIMITGINPDLNFEWDLEDSISELVPSLNAMSMRLMEHANFIEDTMGRRGSIGNSLAMISEQLSSMARRPDTIPARLNVLLENQHTLSQWIMDLRVGPLAIDRFVVGSPEAAWDQPRVSMLYKLWVSLKRFVLSFTKDYEQIGNVYEGEAAERRPVTIWVQRPREWVEIMKEMIDEDFTRNTGIRVNVNTMPSTMDVIGVIKLAAIGGKAPDAAFGIDYTFPVEMAIRNAAVDLTHMPGYDEVVQRFRPGALIPYRYGGGNYALPETQDFQMLFYRKDVLSELGLEVPDTWEDVYAMIPILRRYNMRFAGGAGDALAANAGGAVGFEVFLYKHGGTFYTDDNMRSALDSPEALAAFVEWTDLYTKYGVPIQANFYQHFRTGDMPIGLGNFAFYVTLSVAAPELSGRWGMAPIPGYRQEDGDVARWAPGGAGTRVAMIFNTSDKKEEAWELLKWWTSDEVQERYAHEVESNLGKESRWNTANVSALQTMPWTNEELAAILEQWRWMRDVPVVLGGYMTGRMLGFAWNQMVVQGGPSVTDELLGSIKRLFRGPYEQAANQVTNTARDTLEYAVKEINKELERKRVEFGILPQALGE